MDGDHMERREVPPAEGQPEGTPPARRALSRRLFWALWSSLWAAGVILMGAGVVRLSSDIENSPDFSLAEIKIEGCERVEVELIRSLSGVGVGMNLLAIESGEVSRKLESCPLVESATVVKQFPRGLLIRIRERRPVVLFPYQGAFYCMDGDGVVFSRKASGNLPDLPLLTGLENYPWAFGGREEGRMIQAALCLHKDLSRAGGLGRLSEIHVDPREGLSFYLESFPVQVRIGWDPFAGGIRRLERVLPYLAAAPERIVSVDVRFAGHVFVREREQKEGRISLRPNGIRPPGNGDRHAANVPPPKVSRDATSLVKQRRGDPESGSPEGRAAGTVSRALPGVS